MAPASDSTASSRRYLFRSFAGWHASDLPRDLIAGLTLAAIALPEQMATARLSGFPPQIGLYVFVAGAIGFAIFGANRFLSAGADSTIGPIFAGSLALLAAAGSVRYAELAAMLALAVGLVLVVAGLLRMGWVANLLSVPVTTGFFFGIAIHIAASQLPALLSVPAGAGNVLQQLSHLAANAGHANPWTIALGLGVLLAIFIAELISPQIPGALIGVVGATVCVVSLGLESHGVKVLGVVAAGLPSISMPTVGFNDLIHLAPLTILVAIVVMVQTSATTRNFTPPDEDGDVNRDFVGVGAASILSGFIGAFPVNSSPPRTAVVSTAGGCSQFTGLFAGAAILAIAVFGPALLRHMPEAALSGILLFVAMRITHIGTMREVFRQSFAEFLLMLATVAAMTVLPIQTGVALGVIFSLLHGVYTTTRARVIVFERVPHTSVWWPASSVFKGEILDDILVLGFQAPLSFLNAFDFRKGVRSVVKARSPKPKLLVLEASSIVEIDFTAAQAILAVIDYCDKHEIEFAVARLESVRAQEALRRFGVAQQLKEDHVFHSVAEAIRTLCPDEA